ncbi:MAG: hypothetical protein AAF514_19660, partial [Verrucomicrobiota bacterium]
MIGFLNGLALTDPERAIEIAAVNKSEKRFWLYDALFASMADNGTLDLAAAQIAAWDEDHPHRHNAYRSLGWERSRSSGSKKTRGLGYRLERHPIRTVPPSGGPFPPASRRLRWPFVFEERNRLSGEPPDFR